MTTPKRNEAVARWSVDPDNGYMERDHEGEFVKYTDHVSEVAELTADRDSWRDQASERVKDWDDMRQKAAALQGEVSRLREVLQKIAFHRPIGPTPARVKGSFVDEIERMALDALAIPPTDGC
jgi:hypothetical protein